MERVTEWSGMTPAGMWRQAEVFFPFHIFILINEAMTMGSIQRYTFAGFSAILLIASLSLSQTLSVPFSQWMPWFALQCIALYAFWISAKDGTTFVVARNWFASISLTRVAWGCLLLALGLDALVLLVGDHDNGATRTLLGFHVGPLCVLLVTLFAAKYLGYRHPDGVFAAYRLGWKGTAALENALPVLLAVSHHSRNTGRLQAAL
jgi:hypothetical protein